MDALESKDKDFKVFFENLFDPICQFSRRYIEEEEVFDIAQEAFARTYEHWKEFDAFENAKAFLYTAARNLCIDYLKRKKAETRYLQEYAEEAADDPVFLREVMRQETFRLLHLAIDRLPNQSRQIILLGMEGLSNAEVGEALGISVNTVKTLKKNAYAVLRQFLSKEYVLFLLVLLGDTPCLLEEQGDDFWQDSLCLLEQKDS